jgi:hypothetical protein
MTLTIIHGGQRGVDQGAHEAAIDNGWTVTGYMPRDGRDELGQIPPDVARFLVPHTKPGYGARTEANVQMSTAALIVVQDANDSQVTPGTAKTIKLAIERRLPRMIVDPSVDPALVARWIWNMTPRTLSLPFEDHQRHDPLRLLVAGPRESKWPGAQAKTAGLLRQVGSCLTEIAQGTGSKQDLVPVLR